MYLYIEVIDVVAQAFVKVLDNNSENKKIFYADLDEFGAKVIEKLNEDDGNKAVYIVSRESQQAIVEDYGDYFKEYEENGKRGIALKEGITSVDLWMRFCASMSFRVYNAFKTVDLCRNEMG